MMDGDQTRKEVFTLTVDLLIPKTTIKVGCWNVRTLFQTGRLAQVIHEMKQYKLGLLGITEARWTGAGKTTLATGDTILWSGRKDNQHREGVALVIGKGWPWSSGRGGPGHLERVALVIRKEQNKTLLEWKPISERLLYSKFNSRFAKLSIITAYAPIEDAEDEVKDDFYESLQSAVEAVLKHDVLLVIGDLNARVGNNNTGRERVMGRHGTDTINNNGERMHDLCEFNDLVIGGTILQYELIHKLTRKSPDGKTESQVDHIFINGKW